MRFRACRMGVVTIKTVCAYRGDVEGVIHTTIGSSNFSLHRSVLSQIPKAMEQSERQSRCSNRSVMYSSHLPNIKP